MVISILSESLPLALLLKNKIKRNYLAAQKQH